MNRIHLVMLWHMHQPLYREPEARRYVLPWTRLHALKDYWGMVRVLEEFPRVHATFNVVPSLGTQLEDYASGQFDEPWFQVAFRPVEMLTSEDKLEILSRSFQVNREHLASRWRRFIELYERVESSGNRAALTTFGLRDWRDLQVLSQLAWMDEEWLEHDPVVSELASKGRDFSEKDKERLRNKQLEFLGMVLPVYREAAARGQIELSTTPFYHPILPLVCDTSIARVANHFSPLPARPFRHPEDAREQLIRARAYHQRVFGQVPLGLWPSEGSVSSEALALAAELGFRWFGTDEGVLGRTLEIGFGRDSSGVPANADRLYSPLRVQVGSREITGLFRDHHISDLVGFVYSRMDQRAAAADLHGRLRQLGERVDNGKPLTVSIFLDGENAWEYYPGNGREFLRELYRRVQSDSDIRALTVSEALAEAGDIPVSKGIFPGSWINANFDVWIGHQEDVAAWNLLADARDAYTHAAESRVRGDADAPNEERLAVAFESILAAEGSDWCWWFGPEHSSANDADFDELFRKYLTSVYQALGLIAPLALVEPIKRQPEEAFLLPPTAFLQVTVDGRDTSYFEWLGAGLYAAERTSGAMHGRQFYLHELRYGFDENVFNVRVDPFPRALAELDEFELQLTLEAVNQVRVVVPVKHGKVARFHLEKNELAPLTPLKPIAAAYEKFFEISVSRELLRLEGCKSLRVGIALWRGGLPMDVLPAEGSLEVKLGEEHFGWPAL
ncbi:MAG TPA: glycoside hydrolase family 57 protein [Candidatus Dormibacteraeota bacterium]|nr:glycoside hydrolase family 57 protein [Candidatus Dormibacteraeota bacterium]